MLLQQGDQKKLSCVVEKSNKNIHIGKFFQTNVGLYKISGNWMEDQLTFLTLTFPPAIFSKDFDLAKKKKNKKKRCMVTYGKKYLIGDLHVFYLIQHSKVIINHT